VKIPYAWLREYVDVTVPPEKLGEDLTLVGLAMDGLVGDGEDAVLDVDVTTNRVDCMNVYGLAREVAVIYGLPLRPLSLGFEEKGPAASGALDVAVEAPDLCPRFCARILDVSLGPSPAWLQKRLESVGVRPISNLVDLTNYVMMEMGQPTHAFDLAKVKGGRLHVRWARPGERVTTLDGTLRALDVRARVGVVADAEAPLALAGIMGGASSEVSDATRVVALEAAHWEPLAIRRAARALGMRTEASHRFERGADPEGPGLALARLAHLLEEIGAGSTRPGMIERHPAPRAKVGLALRLARAEAVLGTSVPEGRAREILEGLGFGVVGSAAGRIEVVAPTWRGDVSREIDLVEEVGRHHGLGKIQSALPPSAEPAGLRESQKRSRILREALAAAGFDEVINHVFDSGSAPGFEAGASVRLANPLAEDQSALRRSLLPGLVANLVTNLRQQRRDMALFEVGRVFQPQEGLPREERRLGLLLTGRGRAPHWSEPAGRAADVFDMKGALELLLGRLRIRDFGLVDDRALPPHLHPGQGALVTVGADAIGSYGMLHPDAGAALGLRDEVFVAELNVEAILDWPAPAARVEPLDRFPTVERDLSVFCDAAKTAQALLAVIRASGGERLRSVVLVDRFDRPPVPPGKLSLTWSLRFQDRARTLNREEVEAAMQSIFGALRSAGAEIRSE
jgi:phenylalanyl-tRNA synthetase beta chain